MLREFTLQPGEERRIQVEGRYLVVTKASGPVELTIGGTTPITVDAKDRVYLRDAVNDKAIRIKNIAGGINIFEIHTSDLLVDKRTGVDVKNAIQIAEQQRIGIDPESNIVQSIIQNPVKFDPAQNIVRLDENTNIKITVTPPRLRYQVIPTIEFKRDDTFEIPANPQRETLIISAANHNQDRVWLSTEDDQGIPLHPKERIELKTTERIFTNAPKSRNNELYLGELVLAT